jgi:hypothetical protein
VLMFDLCPLQCLKMVEASESHASLILWNKDASPFRRREESSYSTLET